MGWYGNNRTRQQWGTGMGFVAPRCFLFSLAGVGHEGLVSWFIHVFKPDPNPLPKGFKKQLGYRHEVFLRLKAGTEGAGVAEIIER